ncbi:hypothetical protein PQR11_32540 [Paraburkholderia strydomiana]|uniref:hypothetical protein n=1 Tax=Paraburkholderia strydomiana TaxID=1245417 RepID=UPI0038BE124C
MSMNPATFYRWAVFRPFAAERLERIAVYARAGYFNMGYTLDMFHVIGEIAPE